MTRVNPACCAQAMPAPLTARTSAMAAALTSGDDFILMPPGPHYPAVAAWKPRPRCASFFQRRHEGELVAVGIREGKRAHTPFVLRLVIERRAGRFDPLREGVDVGSRHDVHPSPLPLVPVS